ncbi:aminoglycoside phosphotransferase [Cellulomonas sp.]|uniref:maltokinase N-terminal cap-like domain-containing protein n=1 Tax=Cellulomonas sp. TaxID=40001 RepID=UPI001B08918F|nr:aminoglycoside phosphotransferase [Cellulomonas sp.]MBO9553895.1 phosphotransferase [Cellulomonas sp.]
MTVSHDDDRLVELLRDWLPARRWYPAKGAEAALSVVERRVLADGVEDVLVRVRAGSIDALLQVPLVLARADDGVPDDAIGVLGDRVVLDGAAHPAFVRAWLAAADGPGTAADPATARTVSGEQSNTSVILGSERPAAILKVLRALQPGENPDVEVPRKLVEVGWTHVPEPLAWVEADWPTPDGSTAHGYLGVLSAFVPQAQDGFVLACGYAERGESFGPLAAELGEVVATMHTALVRGFGTDPTTSPQDGPEAVAAALAGRFAWATSAVPALARFARAVDGVLAEVRALPIAPPRQRVHGDLHLGQVLRSTDRWFVTDFEGEPAAPLEHRTRPDLAVRDVAGMLRSFDYAAAVGGLTGHAAAAWTADARSALLEGYAAATDEAPTPVLLRALELDKTLYEVVYESRNRPTWVPIPMAGLDRLLGPA